MYRNVLLAILCSFSGIVAFAQRTTNVNPQVSAINVELPRTPESAGFEKYGNTTVSELTGTPNISIPLYNLKSAFLEVPLTVTYDATGIRVGQEASWIGLGFNLIAGGRITVETRGCVDNHPVSAALFSPSVLAAGMQKIFTRLGNGNNAAILTPGSTCFNCGSATPPEADDWASVDAMAQFGLGEPDIFHASFMGYSISYFYDKITGDLRFIGEKSLFRISQYTDVSGRITNWLLTDNRGISYYFDQCELTSTYLPPQATLYGNSSTTAWLLTKMVHPTGDSIVFSYTNYGKSYPAFTRSASLSFNSPSPVYTSSSDYVQDTIIQDPAYLTKIESKTARIEFVLNNRDDIRGPGSKRLDTIRVLDKLSGKTVKKISFNLSYFNAGSSPCYNTLPDSVSKYYRLRLKLNSLTIDDTASLGSPYQFYYIYENGMPDKFSYLQDHWGYYNSGGTTFDPCSPKALLPTIGNGNYAAYSTLQSIGKNRDCDPNYMQTMTMDSLVYPTGGSTKFIFEPHESQLSRSFMSSGAISYALNYITGGGLRVKEIRNYASGRLSNKLAYEYNSGIYMGVLNYFTGKRNLAIPLEPGEPGPPAPAESDVLSTNGAFNDNDFLVGYRNVRVKQVNAKGQTLGYVSKDFKISSFYNIGNNGLGFDVQVAHWPVSGVTYCLPSGDCQTHFNTVSALLPTMTSNAPSPAKGLDGTLTNERYYDSASNLVKSVDYFHSLRDYSQQFYSIRATDNLYGSDPSISFYADGTRRYSLFVSPAKAYFSGVDSVIEKTYSGSNYIRTKQSYKYNAYGQRIAEAVVNSDGSETVSLTRTALEVDPPHYPISGTGDALLISNLKGAHIYDAPIEQVQLKRTIAGDSLVLQGALHVYSGVLPLKVYRLETFKPLTYKTEFLPYSFTYPNAPNYPSGGNFTLVKDAKYKFFSEADYSSVSQVRAVRNVSGNAAYIWDEHYHTLLASCTEADSSSVAFSSFETQATGRWSFNAAGITTDNTAPTGQRCFNLSTGNVTIAGLNSSKTYIVSFWKKTGAQSVSGKTGVAGITLNGWTYTEVSINNTTTATLAGSGYIDELRLYPQGSQMTTFTHQPLIGVSAKVDPANRISYFEYDEIGRLSKVRDQEKNLVKVMAYKFRDIVSYPFGNAEQNQSFTTTCSTGYASTVINYTVPLNTYGSMISVGDANVYAQADIAAVGPALQAQCTCVPTYSFVPCCGWGTANSSFSLPGTGSVDFSLTLYNNGQLTYGQIGTLSGVLFLPTTDRYVTVSYQGQNYTLLFRTTGVVEIMGNSFTNTITLTGSYLK